MQKKNPYQFLKQWRFTLILIASVGAGAVAGSKMGASAEKFKPLGDIFLNLLFTAVVPLIFFTISSAVASSSSLKRLGRIAGFMLLVFVVTGLISSCVMLLAVKVFDPADGIDMHMTDNSQSDAGSISEKIVATVTTPDFKDILSRRNILALIIFSFLVGIATNSAGDRGRAFGDFLASGSAVMGGLIKLIMLYAPVGIAGYFAYIVGSIGPQIMQGYLRVVMLYYPVALLYFAFGFSAYVMLAGGVSGLKKFWKYIPTPAMIALGTGSSLAAVPANLQAAEDIGIDLDVREIVLPLGATIHMDGSCLAAILKIAVLFSLFDRDFAGIGVMASAVGVSLLCGIVMSGIPGGGFLGEALIVSLYGFPAEALPVIAVLGTLVDPPATMINSAGDTAAAMLVNKFVPLRKAEL